jgi:hypothetical protein
MMGDAKDFARNNSLIYSNLKNEIFGFKALLSQSLVVIPWL